jgi:hypothetical protein
MKKEIRITINPDGTTEIDLKGYEGKGCGKITDELTKALGGEVIKRNQKCEYNKPEQKAKVNAKQG